MADVTAKGKRARVPGRACQAISSGDLALSGLVADDRLTRVLACQYRGGLGNGEPARRIRSFVRHGVTDRERQSADTRRGLGREDEIVFRCREQPFGDDVRLVGIDAIEDEGKGVSLDPGDEVVLLDRFAEDAGQSLRGG